MNNLLEWIKPLRLLPSLTGFLTSMASFALTMHRVDSMTLAFSLDCFISMCATMWHNNYIDRYHDAQKNPPNDFALRKGRAYLYCDIFWWTLELVMLYTLLHYFGLSLFLMALIRSSIGFTYSWMRRVPLLPMIALVTVFVTGAITPAVLSMADRAAIIFSVVGALVICARECPKDIEDCEADLADGWKSTLATIWSKTICSLVGRVIIVIASLLFVSMRLTVLPCVGVYGALASLCLFVAGAYWIVGPYVQKSKLMIDLGIASMLLTLNSSYIGLYYLPPIRSISAPFVVIPAFFALATWAIFTKRGNLLVKFAKLIASGADNGEETFKGKPINAFSWLLMFGLFYLVTVSCRIIGIAGAQICRIDPIVMNRSVHESLILIFCLVLLVVVRIPHYSIPGRTRGYTVIERMTIGLVIGTVCIILLEKGLPAFYFYLVVPMVTIVRDELKPLRDILKSYGCLLGIIASVAVFKGTSYAFGQIMPAYFIVVASYFLKYHKRGLPVYFPTSLPWLCRLMSRYFVQEVPMCTG